MRTVAIIEVDTWVSLSDPRPGQSHRRHHGMSNPCSAHVCIIQRRLIVRDGGAARPGEIKNWRRVVFADLIGPEFGVGPKYLIATNPCITFEIKVCAQRALVLEHNKIPSLRIQRVVRCSTLPMIF